MTRAHIAVIDIGKTNAKLAAVDPDTLREVEVATRPNTVLPGPPYPHFDTEGHWAFLLEELARFHRDHGIGAIGITTHGAAGALLTADGDLAAPILDYEHAGPDACAAAYAEVRPDFAQTGSPRLPGGLNLGAQIFWQFRQDAGLRDRTATVVTYPQYWGHRLTGVAATDVTSLGCHTDLWRPEARAFSDLVDRLGIRDRIAPARLSQEILGPILPEIAARTGLAADTPVHCGIHDSNASLLPHLGARQAPFGVVSTGTWVIALAVGGSAVTLDPARDCLMNVNALGDPVPSARFMGGREYDLLTEGRATEPAADDIAAVLRDGSMLLPAAVPDCGPFQGMQAAWAGPDCPVGTGRRGAAVGFYLALVTARCLSLIGARGPILVEGPFARNRAYLTMLASATGRDVIATANATGTTEGTALLCGAAPARAEGAERSAVRGDAACARYAADWADRVAAREGAA
ncbi:FGGY-family carbohydrate kinase [Jannaschia sp. M317]|uniref:FGGY-family carbohydrate kinase n=1 Tax=Jannaschia sp. M317 TaxID=2867011 RepID=UPI0021A8F084|nr:FGGY-family carbohydrate kinase [Jannaschia sp. M317]UWQ19827.1 FGGY-family carbohydrate kinase [Jannaschia sp. M317]